MNIENINSNEKIYSKEKKPNRLYFKKKIEKKFKKRSKADYFNVRGKDSKIQSKLIMRARKKKSKIQIQKKIYIQKKNKNKIQ